MLISPIRALIHSFLCHQRSADNFLCKLYNKLFVLLNFQKHKFVNFITQFSAQTWSLDICMSSRSKLDTMIGSAMNGRASGYQFSVSDAQWLCETVTPLLASEPTLLEFNGPVNICGDVHGQFNDLVRALQMGGLPPFSKWLFLGDYVDRGPQSVEVICLLFALKIRYPSQVYLIRGNHETPEMTEVFGFAEECLRKLNGTMWRTFCSVFEYLPIGAVISGQYFCVHGGISPRLENLRQIRELRRPLQIPLTGMLTDLLWSDPSPSVREYAPSTRGSTVFFGEAPARRFLANNRLKYIVRGHQVAMDGYDYPFAPNKSVITMFTASNYTPECRNKAAFMTIDQSGKSEIKVLPASLAATVPSLQLALPLGQLKANDGRAKTMVQATARPRTRIRDRRASFGAEPPRAGSGTVLTARPGSRASMASETPKFKKIDLSNVRPRRNSCAVKSPR